MRRLVVLTTWILISAMSPVACAPANDTTTATSLPATAASVTPARVDVTRAAESARGVAWPTTTQQGNKIIQKVLSALSEAGVQIADVVTFTDASDPNSLLGRPHQYIAKAAWRDPTITEEDEPGVDAGGTIEVFLTQGDLQARYDYIDAIASSSPMFAEYHEQNAPAFLRLSKTYLPSQAQNITDIFLALALHE